MSSQQANGLRLPELSVAKRALLEARLRGQHAPSTPTRCERRGDAPLSFAQERLWFLDRLEPGSNSYGVPSVMRLTGELNVAVLERSLGEIVRRHDALRTTFREVGGVPRQVIAQFDGFVLTVDDLSGLEEVAREAELRRHASEESRRGFDLSAGPLFRARLLRLGEDEHALLLCMHHIVSDGWSMPVLFRELSVLYAAYREGRPSPLAELPIQYADYSVWQRERLQGEVLDRQLSYWKATLAGAPELLELPTDHPRPAVQTYRGACVQALFPIELLGSLEAQHQREGATLFMVLLGAFQVLLSRYGGSEDVVVGSPIAGRTHQDTEELIGFFVNTLVVRTDLTGDPSFREVLRRVRERVLGAYEHQDLPFEKLVAELQPERSLSHSPLFQVMFTLDNVGRRGGSLPGLKVDAVDVELGSAKFDLSLGFSVGGGRFEAVVEYSTDLFERSTVERMLGHLERVLEQVAGEPGVRLSELKLMGEAERRRVLEAWNPPAAERPRTCVHELFQEQAGRTPGAVALVSAGGTVTFAGLERASNRLAHRLRAHGVGPETVVAVLMQHSPVVVPTLLGVLKAGGVYFPLDPDAPAERLTDLLRVAGAALVLTQDGLAGRLPPGGPAILTLDSCLADPDGEEQDAALPPLATAENAAYLIYTSGSTGLPKGVVVPHAAAVSHLREVARAYGYSNVDRGLVFAALAFDQSLEDILVPLVAGASVAVRDPGLWTPAELAERVSALGVTALNLPVAYWNQLVHDRDAVGALKSRLRLITVGGEALQPASVLAWEDVPGGEVTLINGYGPTETVVTPALFVIPVGRAGEWGASVPIGRPVGGRTAYVLDKAGEPVPAGVPGELCIGGVEVARGYLGRAELTAERFVPDAFGTRAGGRLYRTGDRVRWRRDGNLEYLGRLDEQVKIRGLRIEPGEIEAVLRRHEAVRECVVVAREDVPGEKRLVGYVVRRDPPAPPVLWPSAGEYPVYDDLLYRAMTADDRRNRLYREALAGCAHAVVVDVGTGADAVLARMAVEAGARRVYAVEAMEASFHAARARIRELGLEDRIVVLHGDADTVELPEPVDFCVSELIGCIGSSEGAVAVLSRARRWLRPGAASVPRRCETWIAAATLPDPVHADPAFGEEGGRYAERIFDLVGHRDDVRLCVRGFPRDHLLSGAALFEELEFPRADEMEWRRDVELRVERGGRLDGLLLWIRLFPGDGASVDSLEDDCNWIPVFFPAFYPGVEVARGDVVAARCEAALSDDGVHPDYRVHGVLRRADGGEEPFAFDSLHHGRPMAPNALHRRLVNGTGVRTRPEMVPVRADAGELRAHLRRSLPEYMVPSAFAFLESLPLTLSGKVDRALLPPPDDGASEEGYLAPRTPVEEVLAGIWAEVLRLERVGARSSFFELGGHSLLAIRAVSRTSEVFAVELPLRAMFESPTVAALAERVEALRRAELPALPPVVPVGRTGPLPLSLAQERLWFLARLEPGSTTYNMPFALRLSGGLEEVALERALGEIVRRHETLRTVFAEVDGSPVQVIAPFGGYALPVEELSVPEGDEREAAVKRRAVEEAARPFDLSGGPLFRATLLRLADEDHVLLLGMHHIVSDGWSMDVLFRELAALYAAYRAGGESPLPELAVQYADFAVWQREQLEGAALDRQLSYWEERLSGAPELLELPTDHPRPPVQTYHGAHVPVDLPAELLERLQALGRREGATLYMVLLGAFKVLLARYCGNEDVVVGSPTAGRTRRETEALIGFFVNTLVLRTELGGAPGFREVLRRVRETTLGAFEHQEVPFEKLVARLQPERSLSHSPLFQVTFSLENAEDSGEALPGLTVGVVDAELDTAKFDLSLGLVATSRGLRGGLTYNTELFERRTVQRMATHLARVLEQVVGNGAPLLAELELLDGAERAQVVEEWNRTEAEYPSDRCIHALFEAQAERTPDAVALLFEGEAVTYRELDRWANRAARFLMGRGMGLEDRVALHLEPGPRTVAFLLGVLKAGGVFVPLDVSSPWERLEFVVADSAVRMILTQAELAGALEGCECDVVRVDRDAALDAFPTGGVESGAGPRSAAYMIYTSGSTGRPKGVVVEHRSVANMAWASIRLASFGPGARTLLFAPLHFDASLADLFPTLCSGATLCLAGREALLPGWELTGLLEQLGITHAKFTPSALAAVPVAPLPQLRVVSVGGEACPASLVEEWGKGRTFLNVYGPTETTVRVTALECRLPYEPRSIGRPIANARTYVLGDGMRPVPIGLPGELYVGGVQVARGYWRRPGLTAERFVPDPFAGGAGARLYRTGDRARWRADGALEYLGRLDGQLKVRGFRIEMGEIEAVLRRAAGVADCAVVAHEDGRREKRLVAYVVGEADTDELRAHLRGSLPEYMVPGAFVRLDRLPLTPNGKLDRRALPAPNIAFATAGCVAPRTPAEEVLAGIWAEVLGLERVGAEDGFFELGGHSLLATRVVSRVREAFGVELPLRTVFELPTVAELAGRVEEIRRAGAPALPAVMPSKRTTGLPLSFAQERLWFLDRMQPGGTTYNMPLALRLDGALDVRALERALGEVVRRHEALRTVFREVDGAPVQVIEPFTGFALVVEDLSGPGGAEVERRAGEEAATPFDLERGPLFRARLLRAGAEEHALLLCMHHVVSDGWSMDVLFRELAALYAAYRAGGESPLPEPAVQYADYAVWQRRQLAGEALERQLAYWKAQLAGAPELLELPTDHPRPPAPSFRGGTVQVELPAGLQERLGALGRREGATPFMTLLGAFQLLLSRYAGSEDVVVGSPIAGRTRRETEGLIGFFVNTLVLRVDLGGDPPFRELLRRVREVTLGAYEHQDVPFEKLVAELRPERSLSHSPLFQVSFTFGGAGGAEGAGVAIPELRVAPLGSQPEPAKFDLSLGLAATPRGLRGGLTYATDLFESATVERMAGHLARVLEQVAGDADLPLSALELMGEAERAQVVGEWRPRAEHPVEESIHRRFEARARQAPDAVALVCEGASLTYAQLDERADRLARGLRGLGVGPETRVGLCLERSPDTVAAVLGVLKAGGAYVPIDPAYPPERIAYLLEDSGAALVVVQETTRGVVADSAAPVLTFDELLAGRHDGGAALPADPDPASAAYVIYTSGSTGRPKGVVVTHASVLRLFDATDAWFGFEAEDVWTLFHSYAFDFSVWEIWGALLFGGRLVVVPFGTSRDPAAFRALLAREGVTVLNQTPSAFRQLVRADEGTADDLTLRWVVFGGEALEPRSLKPWFDRHGDQRPRLVNMYGITETTVHVTFRPVRRADAESGAGSRIGEAIPDLGVYLLDAWLEPVPHGAPGEMFVGGAGAARGYLGRPALTAERFLPDPFAGAPGARMYRSGDRARRRAGGDLEYLGRGDQQVKIRGFRIEPGEVEAALLAHPGVREALVVAREDEPGARRLVAYVVAGAAAQGEPTAASLRAGLAARLPDYMVPAAFVLLDALPLTPHGKTDRRALPAPDGAQRSAVSEYVPPRGPVEEALAGAWAETLGMERVGAHDNYFALGGDSMRAIQLLARARERGVPFSLQDLFRHQTVAELAAHVLPAEQVIGEGAAGPFALLALGDRERVPEGVEDAYPMTQLQLGMLFHSERRPEEAVYHNVQAFSVRAAFDGARLRGALATLAARHPVLRTSFELAAFSEPMQLVHRRVEVPLAVTCLARLAPEAQGAAMDAWVEAERQRAFDRGAAPLIRFHVHTLGPDAFQFGFTEHHSILDGWSVAAMLTELFGLYFAVPRPRDEAPPASVLREFVALEREVLASAEARAFWAETLEDSAPTLPGSLGPAGGAGNRSLGGPLPAGVAAGLAGLARREGLPLKSFLLAAHLRVLAAAAGTDDVVTGLVSNGRPEGAGAERALGLFLNTVPLRLRLRGGSWLELARAGFAEERRMLPFRRFPAAELQRMRGGDPAFAALFNFVHFHVMDGVAAEAGERVGGESRGSGGTNFAFGASFEATHAGVQLSVEYDSARYSDAEAERLFGRYLAVLARIVEDPHGRYDAFDLLSGDERARIAAGWSAAGATAPAAGTLHGLFAAQAARTPDAPALECGGETLTYAALERRAGELARLLRRRGVGPEVAVGICCGRSVEMVVGLLAILRAGGTYVPLDPAYPLDRLAFVLADSGARLLLADEAAPALPGAPGMAMLLLDDARASQADGEADLPDTVVDARSAAYLIYTSGSTGSPKGVVVEHGAAAAHLSGFARQLGLLPSDRMLHSASVGFDVSIDQIFLPFAAGATLVLRGPEPWSPAEWPARAGGLGITVADLPPAYLREVAETAVGSALPGLRLLLTGADAVPSALVERWRAAVASPARLVNGYGPTEAVVTATAYEVPAGYPGAFTGPVVPIGAALPGRAAYVLDAFGAPTAEGVPGELCLGGALLARGYLGRPGPTAAAFVPDPFAVHGTAGGRMYRTGDRVRRLPGGVLEFLGRTDAQVKVRGFRIEPGEVEAALALHPAVREAVVVAREDAGEGRRLVAYLLAAPGADAPSAAELRAHLRGRLPEHMVPSAFVALDALPLTPNGKLDRRALPAPEAARGEDSFLAPRDWLELRLARLWEELLGVGPVGVRDDFFALGGHSLLALRLVGAVERLTGRRLPLATMIAGPTVEGLARALRGEAALPASGPLVPIQPAGGVRPLFFVHAAGGNVVSYAALARRLGPGQPFYGLQSRGLQGEEPPHAGIPEMADDYLAHVRAVQAEGPYRLGGWSMGGLVAFEMACRLEAAGEEVEFLALVDSHAPGDDSPAPDPDDPRLLADFVLHLGLAPEQIPLSWAEAAALPPGERLRRAWEVARAADIVPEDLDSGRFERLWTIFRANAAAAAAYRPRSCASDLLLLLAEDRAAPAAPEVERWRALTTGTVRSATVPGDHFTLVREPHVGEFAAVLSEALAPRSSG